MTNRSAGKAFLVLGCIILLLSSCNERSVIFRYDDFVLQENQLQDSLISVFSSHSIPLTIGVIPFDEEGKANFDSSYVEYLKPMATNGTLEVALHGYNHTRRTDSGEFGGLGYNEQKELIFKSKALLDSLFKKEVVTFIPPWNDYDANTLNALDEAGIHVISSALHQKQETRNMRLSYLPETAGEEDPINSIDSKLFKRNGVSVIMLHHYDFENKPIAELASKLESIRNDGIHAFTFSEYVIQHRADGKRFRSNLEQNLLYKSLHCNNTLLSYACAIAVKLANLLIYLLIYFLLLFASNKIIFRKNERHTTLNRIFSFLGAIFVTVIVWLHILTPKKSMLLMCAIAVLIPLTIRLYETLNNYHQQKQC